MMAVANDADFFRANGPWKFRCRDWFSAQCSGFVVDPDFDPDPVELFLAALPRTSSAISAAGFFLVLSSSEDRLEDMMVSKVP